MSDNVSKKRFVGAYIDEEVEIGENVKILPNVYILGKCKIGDNVVIYPNTTIENSTIGKGSVIKSSFIENSIVEENVTIGPFAHLRPNSHIKDNCKVGNFVEIKNATLNKGTKVGHLAYVGDADLGEKCNVGCGAIFVNYNGRTKSRTSVGNNCFIGSNCNIIASVNISDNTYICAGTTLTKNTENDDFVIGRCREEIKNHRASKYLKEMM